MPRQGLQIQIMERHSSCNAEGHKNQTLREPANPVEGNPATWRWQECSITNWLLCDQSARAGPELQIKTQARPMLRGASQSGTVGRSTCTAKARIACKSPRRFTCICSKLRWCIIQENTNALRPNPTLNRTVCGGPSLGFKSIAQTRPAANCRLALR